VWQCAYLTVHKCQLVCCSSNTSSSRGVQREPWGVLNALSMCNWGAAAGIGATQELLHVQHMLLCNPISDQCPMLVASLCLCALGTGWLVNA
jgi:hypothetical protein